MNLYSTLFALNRYSLCASVMLLSNFSSIKSFIERSFTSIDTVMLSSTERNLISPASIKYAFLGISRPFRHSFNFRFSNIAP